MSRRIIYVPGKNVKPEPDVHRAQLWRCLLAGVRHVSADTARELEREPGCFQLAAWNYLFYGRHGSLDADIPWIDRLIDKSGASPAERREARSWHKAAVKLMYALGDRLHGLIKWIPDARVKAMIADTAPYFENHDGVADRIREEVGGLIVDAARCGQRVLLIGHSLGSVIAYEALWRLAHRDGESHTVDMFLTAGSPLGMRYVQRRLQGYRDRPPTFPRGIRTWHNVSATGDLISVDERVSDDFRRMAESGAVGMIRDHRGEVYNWFRNDAGLNVHRSYGYLVNPVVGRLVADWWNGEDVGAEPVMVAHRGYPAKFPENTLIGFEQAVAAGARWLELDIQLSRDGVPVLYHDADTLRVSGVKGSLLDMDLCSVRRLDASFPQRFGETYRGNPVATLEEFCQAMGGWPEVQVFVEVKSESVDRFGVRQTVDAVVAAMEPVLDRCVLISFHRESVEYAQAEHAVRVGWVLTRWDAGAEAQARAMAPDFILAGKKMVPADDGDIWRGPWQWAVYVVDDPQEAGTFPARGIRYVETDRIGDMLPALEATRT